ncbi:TPA_asm: N [Lupinus gammacytorhabdovirus 1]|nr:TPA_asm: N [Lupinus gammacytorhabdovirus 1]
MDLIDVANLQPLPEYDAVADLTPTLSGNPEAVWNDDNFDRIPGWANVALDDAQLTVTGGEWLAEITGNNISSRTIIKGLRLAMSLKSMVPGRLEPLLRLKDRAGIVDAVPYTALPDVNTFSNVPYTLRHQQVQGNAVEAPQNVVLALLPPIQPVREESNESRLRAYPYLAAYLMRLLVKDPDNIINGLNNMKGRYESFYGPSVLVSQFAINRAQATAYRDACAGQANVISTYTMALAYVQNTRNLDDRETGILSYLGYLPFSYTGMHAYTLLMELRRDTGVPLNKLLTMFYADVNRTALHMISVILNTYERTTVHPDRSVYFRYSACWGAHYFSSVKSRNCPYLVYTIAAASKVISATDNFADPERIVAVQRLSDVMKRTLKVAGEIIGNSLKQNMLVSANSSRAYAMAVVAGAGAVPVAQEEDVWDFIA